MFRRTNTERSKPQELCSIEIRVTLWHGARATAQIASQKVPNCGQSGKGAVEEHLGAISVPDITIDRKLFQRLVDRYYKLEIEHRSFRAMLDETKRRNPQNARDIEARYQMLTDSLRNDPFWIESEAESADAWAVEDDDAFLAVLDRFLSHRESGQ
jgi:hypothetical protein